MLYSTIQNPTAFLFSLFILVFTASVVQAQDTSPQEKLAIATEADLPRYTYKLPTKTASELLTNEAAFNQVAAQVRSDIEALLSDFIIKDKTTLRRLYDTLENLALLRDDYESALEYTEIIRKLQQKPAEQLTSGLLTEAVVAAEKGKGDKKIFQEKYSSAINKLPWDVVQDVIEEQKGRLEIFGPNFLTGIAQSQFDPGAVKSSSISGKMAHQIIGMRTFIEVEHKYKGPTVKVLQDYIAANRTEKPNIWTNREVSFKNETGLTPVVIGVWDSGVDPSVFGDNMFTNKAETINGKDDDGNGYVDDLHGIAYTLWGAKTTSNLLYPLKQEDIEQIPEMQELMKGFGDVQASVKSTEAQALKKKMSQLQSSEVRQFIERLRKFSSYTHATHVAGIAAEANSASRILTVRITFPYQFVHPPPMEQEARKWASSLQQSIGYFKKHKARVVNMSWSVSIKDIEKSYEVNGIGNNAEERQKMAAEVFGILMDGMKKAMQRAPEILFVPAAGNSDADVEFVKNFPASINLPNVFTVGAVDQAGDGTSFTSYGKSVQAYANGFEVESYLPGGDRIKFSGTSMAAPQVTNLAGKLFALDPSLTPEEVIDLILEGATPAENEEILLIHPKRSVELLKTRN